METLCPYVEALLGLIILNYICKAIDDGTFKTENVLEFVEQLGLSGKCLCNAGNILQTWCLEQKDPGRPGYFKISKVEALKIIIDALRHPSVQQNMLADKLSSSPEGDVPHDEIGLLSDNRARSSTSSKWKRWKAVLVLAFTIYCLGSLMIQLHTTTTIQQACPAQSEETLSRNKGLVGMKGVNIRWINMCSSEEYTASLSDLPKTIEDYAVAQEGNYLFLCGGRSSGKDANYNQSKTCLVQSLLTGEWTPFEHLMNEPRIKSHMFVDGRKVIVQSGILSDPLSKTGCRATQELFDMDKQSAGWVLQDMEDTCLPSELVPIDCQSISNKETLILDTDYK